MSDFNPPSPIVFPDPGVFPDVKFFAAALVVLDADDKELAAENVTLNQQLADLQAQVAITQGLLKRNQGNQDNQDAARAFIMSKMPAGTLPPTDAAPKITGITSTTPDGTLTAGQTVSLDVAFSKFVTVTGTPQLTLSDGGVADYQSGSGTSVLTFNHVIAAGETTSGNKLDVTALSLNGATVDDASATPASLVVPAAGASGSLSASKAIIVA